MKRLRDVISIDEMERLLESQERIVLSEAHCLFRVTIPPAVTRGWELREARDGVPSVILTPWPGETLAEAMEEACRVIRQKQIEGEK